MKRISAQVLGASALLGFGVGYLIDHMLTSAGRATFTPSWGLPILLVMLAAALIALALPVRKSLRTVGHRVDPFRALHTATLARASSILGAGLTGVAAGLGVFLLTRPVSPPIGSVWSIIVAAVSALVLMVAALVAESFCALPPNDGLGRQDRDDEPSSPDDASGYRPLDERR